MVFIQGKDLIELDERALQIMLHSSAVLTTSDISAKELFTKMVNCANKDYEKPEKER